MLRSNADKSPLAEFSGPSDRATALSNHSPLPRRGLALFFKEIPPGVSALIDDGINLA
jgi:hypothetical protein